MLDVARREVPIGTMTTFRRGEEKSGRKGKGKESRRPKEGRKWAEEECDSAPRIPKSGFRPALRDFGERLGGSQGSSTGVGALPRGAANVPE